jgi:hypothetical protein
MSADPKDEALDIIHDFALNLMLREDLAPEVEHDLELIHALARYKHDVLSNQDRQRLTEIRRLNERGELPDKPV